MPVVTIGSGAPQLTALAGLRVLDLSHGVAGPFAARLIGDLGAEVIKVEEPVRGDFARREEPLNSEAPEPEQSLLFQYLNWNKRGVTLDLRNEASHGALRRLVERSDVLIEAFRPGMGHRRGAFAAVEPESGGDLGHELRADRSLCRIRCE
jgi:crotonobetainyl-CoA:carnitine CoA-transferase CaiB-like acyl-CoA transferase